LIPVNAAAESNFAQLSENWRLTGRLQLDGAMYDSQNPLFQDDTGVRRGRIALKGKLWDVVSMKFEYELSGSTPGPKSMWVRQQFGKHTTLTVGHFKEPFSLQNSTSSRYNTFMERALSNMGSPGYRLGAKLVSYDKYWSVATGVTGGALNDKYQMDNEGVGFFARAVMRPVSHKNSLVHIGLSSEIRKYDLTDSIQLRSRPESDLTDVRLVDTLALTNLDRSLRIATEFAMKRKAVHFEAEYLTLQVDRIGAAQLDFSGWYAQAGWFITGESRRYRRSTASFTNTRPDNPFGAWEIALRYSELDLNSAEIAGGSESNIGVALNWYATDDIRVSLNYIDASADPAATGLNDDVSVIQARFQFIF